MHPRLRLWLAIGAALVLLYTAIGFWLVPAVARDQLTQWATAELGGRQASVEALRFNPYTLRLEAEQLRLAEADGAPLVAVGQLVVEMQWRSIVRRAWSFAEIRIVQPVASLAIAPDGRFNFGELLASLQQRKTEPSQPGPLPRLIVERFALEQGRVDLRDRQAGYENSFFPIQFALDHFSTLPDQSDAHTFSAQSKSGGKLRWKGETSVNPIRGSGELVLEDASLPELAVYLKSATRATVGAGKLSATLPYRFAYADGRFEASLAGASVSLRDLAVAREGASDSFASMTRLDVRGVDADFGKRSVTVGEVKAQAAKLRVVRDAKGELDIANLMVQAAGPQVAPPTPAVQAGSWKLELRSVLLEQLALSALDEGASPPLKVEADPLRLQLTLNAQQQGDKLEARVSDAALSIANLQVTSGSQAPFKLAKLGFEAGAFDLTGRRATLGRVYAEGGQVQLVRDAKGQLNLLAMLPKPAVSATAPAGPKEKEAKGATREAAFVALAKRVELANFAVDIDDQSTGVKLGLREVGLQLDDASSDTAQPLKFSAALKVKEGGVLAARGRLVPDTGVLQADVKLQQLALAPVQPLLARQVKLKLAAGTVSAQGKLTAGEGKQAGSLRYAGAFSVDDLALNEDSGELFAAWKSVAADALTLGLSPNRLEIPELRIVEPNAKLIIEDNRSLNATRLLVVQPAPAGAAAPAAAAPAAVAAPAAAPSSAPAAEAFPVRIARVRLTNAKLDFADLSLRPQFGAKIYELGGVITGLSSAGDARSNVELDGRVDEFGLARVRGALNPFALRDNTDLSVVFRNVDMVSASPYSMKFAGYRIAEGKISLDLQYKIRNNQLEGDNKIVIDKLTLGERVDSPDALKIPLELALAILKDSDGRIDLGLPVSGDMNDPQFSYGAIIWKAIGNVLTKIVTAPFRALGALLGVGGDKLEAIDFDAGSERLLPPEREKIKQLAQLLAKRPQLKLSVPGQYSEAADSAAMRVAAVRLEVARRAGIALQPGEDPGPLDVADRKVRTALRELYAARFGEAALDQQKKAAEAVPAAGAASAPAVPVLQRMTNLVQGEPQVADAGAFYRGLLQRLEREQALPAGAMAQLGTQRAAAIVLALKEAGADAARAVATAPEAVQAEAGKPVPVKLSLGAK
jgi:hypothetical protein